MKTERATWEEARTGISTATVTAISSATRLSVSRSGEGPRAATLALAGGGYVARAGDTVLVAETDSGDLYVIGVVTALRLQPAADEVDHADPVIVRDRTGKALLEHDPLTGKTVLHAIEGDLELRADHGSVTVSAREDVKLHGERRIDLSAPSMRATAARAEAFFAETRLVGRSLETAVERVRQTMEVLETNAKRIVERAKQTYREADDLAQTRAGRVRTVVRSTFHVLAEKAILKAEEDVKLKGKKIHLA